MYYVAKVNSEMCSTYKCNMCTLYCPEPNTLMFDKEHKHGNEHGTSWVDEDIRAHEESVRLDKLKLLRVQLCAAETRAGGSMI